MVGIDFKNKPIGSYDVIVVGGGHAGIEAAAASARMGSKTLMLTANLDSIGLIACSATFGGPGRGQLLRELDVFGCLTPLVVDESAIHLRRSGKDTGTWAPFAVCDRSTYQKLAKNKLELIANLDIKQDSVVDLFKNKGKWQLNSCTNQAYICDSLVVAGGTFLRGRTHQGTVSQRAGRSNETSSDKLCLALKKLGIEMVTFRTGTGPTVQLPDKDIRQLERQSSDRDPRLFSRKTCLEDDKRFVPTYKTHLELSRCKALKNIRDTKKAKGPRHCPSLFDKIASHPDKKEFPVFLQPETIEADAWFMNGLSMDLSEREQTEITRAVRGLSGASVVRFGYSVTYSCIKHGQLKGTMDATKHKGLFFAGQVTGSNGYEEASATGLVAGINAALSARGEQKVVFSREQSFLGVLADDLSTKKINEPYRIMLSRADNFVKLRTDNADNRLAKQAYSLGLCTRTEVREAECKADVIDKILQGKNAGVVSKEILREVAAIKNISKNLIFDIELISGDLAIGRDIKYREIGISKEAVEKLEKFMPKSISEANRLDIPERSIKALALYLQRVNKN